LVGLSRKKALVLRPHRGAPFLELRAVDEGRGDAEAGQKLLADEAAGAEELARRDDVVAGAQLSQERGRHRRHAGRGGARRLGALERCHARLEHADRRVREAGVDVAFVLALEARLALLRRLVDVPLSEEERLGGLAEIGAEGAGMDEPRLELEVVVGCRGTIVHGQPSPGTAPGTDRAGRTRTGRACPRPFSALLNVARKPAGSNHHGRQRS
jgi:hypothetical protein